MFSSLASQPNYSSPSLPQPEEIYPRRPGESFSRIGYLHQLKTAQPVAYRYGDLTGGGFFNI